MGLISTIRGAYWSAILPPAPELEAGAAATVASGLGVFSWDPLLGHVSRTVAMSLPAIGRARDVLCGSLAQVPLRAYNYDRVSGTYTAHDDPPVWLDRPDPNRTRGALISDLADDLAFHAVSYLWITSRGVAGYPASFQHLPAAEVSRPDPLHGEPRARAPFRWNGIDIPVRDVVVIESPQSAALAHGWRTIASAVSLEDAAQRFADTEVPAGWLKQTGGVPLSGTEQSEMAQTFAAARHSNTVAMLSEHVEWHESSYDPSRLQLTESRDHAATDQARLMNVPAGFVHAPTNESMTYTNTQEQRQDLWSFGLAPLATAITDTLSGPNVTPRGTVVRFDPTDLISDPFDPTTEGDPPDDGSTTNAL